VSFDSAPNLPYTLSVIAKAAGLPAALALAKERGGSEIYIPKKAHGTILGDIVGVEAAEKIIKELGVGLLLIPFGPVGGARARRAGVRRALEDGASIRVAAQKNDVHTRTAKRIKARTKQPRAPDFFD